MKYKITIQGRGGHSSRPDRAINPLDCFVSVFAAIQRFSPTITQVDGGTAVNVIPDRLIFMMECDTSTAELEQVIIPICKLYRCTFEVTTSIA